MSRALALTLSSLKISFNIFQESIVILIPMNISYYTMIFLMCRNTSKLETVLYLRSESVILVLPNKTYICVENSTVEVSN